ncbi:MAG: 6-phosphofructokinase [Chloroflexi bacterium]|jgi:6-phosphofructokinase 1|nr:6-phosphofructokinase [Chloroflexota bacterium]
MKRIAVLTSGGDAPGMNAAIRAITRTGLEAGLDVFGVRNGYSGLIDGDFVFLSRRDVGGIMQLGGTMLGSARSQEFYTEEGRRKAIENLKAEDAEALFVIGGNGSQTGAFALYQMGFPVVGVASTIDNDLAGTDVTIGVDTAINVALEAIDRLKVTAESHRRAFLVEVMGRKCGFVALMAGIAGGAEVVVIPEREMSPDEVAAQLRAAHERGKGHAMVVVAEGAHNNAQRLIEYFEQHPEGVGFKLRATILGHVQRGANPTSRDRLLATRLGEGAVRAWLRGEQGVLTGLQGNRVVTTPLEQVVNTHKQLDLSLFDLSCIMSM